MSLNVFWGSGSSSNVACSLLPHGFLLSEQSYEENETLYQARRPETPPPPPPPPSDNRRPQQKRGFSWRLKRQRSLTHTSERSDPHSHSRFITQLSSVFILCTDHLFRWYSFGQIYGWEWEWGVKSNLRSRVYTFFCFIFQHFPASDASYFE